MENFLGHDSRPDVELEVREPLAELLQRLGEVRGAQIALVHLAAGQRGVCPQDSKSASVFPKRKRSAWIMFVTANVATRSETMGQVEGSTLLPSPGASALPSRGRDTAEETQQRGNPSPAGRAPR